jgi:anaerobic magnesium-protoporphyrin IX monomethyl ester cyclase
MFRVALVYPYVRTRSQTETLFPPLGLAGLTSQLRSRHIDTKVFDGTFSTLTQLRRDLLAYQPDIVGVYIMVTLSSNAERVAAMVRNDLPDCLIIAGGPLPTLYPERFSRTFDLVFQGEADLGFPQFCADVSQSAGQRSDIRQIPTQGYDGLFVEREGIRIQNPSAHHTEAELEAFPLPDRRDFDHARYQQAWQQSDGSRTTSILTSLGCPFSCDFCSRPVFGSLFRRRNLDQVFEEIEQIRQLGYDSLWIADDNFTLDHRHLLGFCQRIAAQRLRWSCLSRVTGLERGTTDLMKESGCRRVYLGLETGSQATLRLMNKKATIEEGVRAVELFHETGIEVAAFFIVGYPGETVASIEETFRFALSLPLDQVSFNVPFPLPGSRLYDRVTGLDRDRDWEEENEITFVYDSQFDPAWLRGRIQQTLFAFSEKRHWATWKA